MSFSNRRPDDYQITGILPPKKHQLTKKDSKLELIVTSAHHQSYL